jgi:hypothetical protein
VDGEHGPWLELVGKLADRPSGSAQIGQRARERQR